MDQTAGWPRRRFDDSKDLTATRCKPLLRLLRLGVFLVLGTVRPGSIAMSQMVFDIGAGVQRVAEPALQ